MKKAPRVGAQAGYNPIDLTRAHVWAAMLAVLTFVLGGFLTGKWLGSAGMALFAWLAVRFVTLRIAHGAGKGFLHALQPSGASTPYQAQYSYQESLAAKGDVAGAIESFEALLAESPDDCDARVRVADLYARSMNDPARAATHFRKVQATPDAPSDKVVYASNRLVDLYMGPLDDEGKALVELRRLIERFPGSAVANQARAALARIKARRAT